MDDNIEAKAHHSEAVGVCEVEFLTAVVYDWSGIIYRLCRDGGTI